MTTPFVGVKGRDAGALGFRCGFGRVIEQRRYGGRRRVSVVRNSGNDRVELRDTSRGSPLLVSKLKYCESVSQTIRRKTRTVMVGDVGIGSDHPIRIQTMTTTDTKDVAATVEQVMRIADKGADIVRITVKGKKEADACFDIKNALVQKNYNIPLVADINFDPSIALRVTECFEKIRVNPGNFAGRRPQFELLEYSEDDYQHELEHTEQVFAPLVEKCNKYGRTIHVGTIHGSLSDHIRSYYGDSPRGMVESAFEFARICRKMNFHNFVFSMNASNPVVMVQAYRLLVSDIYADGWDYPLHLGDTEAGEGEDGRMKCAIGIGTLLQEGIGDTIMVSLTEPPQEEIDPCRRLAKLGARAAQIRQGMAPFEEKHRHYFDFQRRSEQLPLQKEGEEVDYRGVLHRDGSVLMSVSLDQLKKPELFYKSLAAKLVVGPPFKDQATVDSTLLRELPPPSDVDSRPAVKRVGDKSMGGIAPLSVRPAIIDYVDEAVEALKSSRVIAVPTDTLYGLACSACSREAIQRVYGIKGRAHTKPLAICVADVEDIKRFVATDHLPRGLLHSLLPGPVTLVLDRGEKSEIEISMNPGNNNLGVRVPDSEFIRAIARGLGTAVALTSANLSGKPSSVSVNEFKDIWAECAHVYDGGSLPCGRAGSTVIDLSAPGSFKILRAGSAHEETVRILRNYLLTEQLVI